MQQPQQLHLWQQQQQEQLPTQLRQKQQYLGEAQLEVPSVETLVPGPLLLLATETPEPI